MSMVARASSLFREQHVGDAARGIAAAFDLDAVVVPDPHARRRRSRTAPARSAGRSRCRSCGRRWRAPVALIDGKRARPRVEHDEIVAEPVHLAKIWLPRRSWRGYMGISRAKASAFAARRLRFKGRGTCHQRMRSSWCGGGRPERGQTPERKRTFGTRARGHGSHQASIH